MELRDLKSFWWLPSNGETYTLFNNCTAGAVSVPMDKDAPQSTTPSDDIPEDSVFAFTHPLDEATRLDVKGIGYPLNLMTWLYYEYGSEPLHPDPDDGSEEEFRAQPSPES